VSVCHIFANPDIKYETEKRIVQYIIWEEQKDVLNYELIIEKLTQGRWQSVLRETSEAAEVKTALEPGQYRYRVDVVDLLGRRRPSAEWSRLTVLRALQPEITSFSPVSHNIDDSLGLTVHFKGAALEENAAVSLVLADGKIIVPDKIEIARNKESGTAYFKPTTLIEGYWSLRIENPGGLETSMSTLAVVKQTTGKGFGKPLDKRMFAFSEGYACFFPVAGKFTSFFDSSVYPAGAMIRFTFFPLRLRMGSLGIELEPSWNYMESEGIYYGANYMVEGHLFSGGLNFVYHKKIINNRFAINIRAGGGMAVLYNLRVQQQDDRQQWIVSIDKLSGFVPYAAGSAGFSFIFNGIFFVELGGQYRILFSNDIPLPMFAAPSLSVGLFF
jgi:hypothetical protein